MIDAANQLGKFLKADTKVRSEYALAAIDLVDGLASQMRLEPARFANIFNGDVTAVITNAVALKQKVEG